MFDHVRSIKNSNNREHLTRLIIWCSIGSFGIFVASAVLLGKITGLPASEVPVFLHGFDYPIWSLPAILAFAVSGTFFALFVPGFVWIINLSKLPISFSSLFHRAFVINLILAIIGMSLWKAISGLPPSRTTFIAWQIIITLPGLIVFYKKSRRSSTVASNPNINRAFLIGLLVVFVMLPILLWGKVFVEDLSGDGTECIEFSRSLNENYFPSWDLENGNYGFYPSFMLFSYPNYFTMLTLGECESAVRWPVLFYIFGIYLILYELVNNRKQAGTLSEAAILLGACSYFLIIHSFHSGYQVIFTDMAEPPGVDMFFTFLAASALFSMIKERRAWWAIFAFLGTTALSSGLVFALSLLFAKILVKRPSIKEIGFDAIAFGGLWGGYKIMVYFYASLYPIGLHQFSFINIFANYGFGINRIESLLVVKSFVLLSGILPALSLVFLLKRDQISMMTGIPVLLYLTMLILFGRSHSHYMIPIVLFPTVIFLRNTTLFPKKIQHLLLLGFAVILLSETFFAFPKGYQPHTRFREFGSETLMRFDDYPKAVEAAHSIKNYFVQNESKWNPKNSILKYLGWHTWVYYSDREPVIGKQYRQILTQAKVPIDIPVGWQEVRGKEGWVLYFDENRSVFRWLYP